MTAPAQAEAFGREFNEARRAQGFKSQAHLDAFYVHHDHVATCTDGCSVGPSIPVDDGWQPTRRECPEAIRLLLLSWSVA